MLGFVLFGGVFCLFVCWVFGFDFFTEVQLT